MDIKGHKADIRFDTATHLFRGEFVGLNGGVDFYAADLKSLQKEGALSLKVLLDMCSEDGVAPADLP